MFCMECGALVEIKNKFCPSCGLPAFRDVQPISNKNNTEELSGEVNSSSAGMSFTESISTCLAKYTDFDGRASRSEFWWFMLFDTLLSWGARLIDSSSITYWIVWMGFFMPSLAVGSRRLHDINKSGFLQLLALTGIGLIFLIIWFAAKGDDKVNRYDFGIDKN